MSETLEITRAEARARDRYHPMRSTPKACIRGYVCERVSFNARCLAGKRGQSGPRPPPSATSPETHRRPHDCG